MDSYKTIFENNRQWVERKTDEDKDFFKKLVKEQNPDFLYPICGRTPTGKAHHRLWAL